jgi:hypothetical protein
MKPGSNSVEDHPQLSHNRHPVDGALVGVGSLWPSYFLFKGAGEQGFLVFFPCSQSVPNVFPKMIPIAPGFYPIWFAKSLTPLYIH